MPAREITTDEAPPPGGAFSLAVTTGRLLFTAGQTGIDPNTGSLPTSLDDQLRQAIANLEVVIRAAGGDLSDVVKTTCFLADIGDFAAFDAIYRDLFPQPWPARSTFGVALAGDLRCEIEAVAVIGGGDE